MVHRSSLWKNAYLVISPSIKHGDDLICSYPSCCKDGPKFRFCSVCRIPVAKRNFHQRHSHDEVGLSAERIRQKSSQVPPTPTTTAASSTRTSSVDEGRKFNRKDNSDGHKRKKLNKIEAGPVMCSLATTSIAEGDDVVAAAAAQGIGTSGSDRTIDDDDGVDSSWRPDTRSGIPVDRQRRWAALLKSRPTSNEANALSYWLEQVIEVSAWNVKKKTTKDVSTKVRKTDSPPDHGNQPTPMVGPTRRSSGESIDRHRRGGSSSSSSSSSKGSSSSSRTSQGDNAAKRRKLQSSDERQEEDDAT